MITTANSPKIKNASRKAFQEAGEDVVRFVDKPTSSPAAWHVDSEAELFELSDGGASPSSETGSDEPLMVPKQKRTGPSDPDESESK